MFDWVKRMNANGTNECECLVSTKFVRFFSGRLFLTAFCADFERFFRG